MERILPLLSGAHLTGHCTQFPKRENSDPQTAQAEAVVFSWLRTEKPEPRLFEDAGTGGPDFCTYSDSDHLLVEATSLDSEMVSERSGLPTQITGSGGGAFALMTKKLKTKAKSKAVQLAGHKVPTVFGNHFRPCVCEHSHGQVGCRISDGLSTPDQRADRRRSALHEY